MKFLIDDIKDLQICVTFIGDLNELWNEDDSDFDDHWLFDVVRTSNNRKFILIPPGGEIGGITKKEWTDDVIRMIGSY